jgi:hypothetical protein
LDMESKTEERVLRGKKREIEEKDGLRSQCSVRKPCFVRLTKLSIFLTEDKREQRVKKC